MIGQRLIRGQHQNRHLVRLFCILDYRVHQVASARVVFGGGNVGWVQLLAVPSVGCGTSAAKEFVSLVQHQYLVKYIFRFVSSDILYRVVDGARF